MQGMVEMKESISHEQHSIKQEMMTEMTAMSAQM